MVYISFKRISQSQSDATSYSIIEYNSNQDFIDSITSRKNDESRQNGIEAYALLDSMLLSLTSIKKAVLRRSENGKPYIENENVSFNVSHTDGAVACIIDTDGGDVGIDAEQIGRDGQKIIDRFFDTKAKEMYSQSADKPFAFAKIWTQKEAYAKFTGTGLSDYSTDYPATCKFTCLRDGTLLVTACTTSDATVQIWQNDEDCPTPQLPLD